MIHRFGIVYLAVLQKFRALYRHLYSYVTVPLSLVHDWLSVHIHSVAGIVRVIHRLSQCIVRLCCVNGSKSVISFSAFRSLVSNFVPVQQIRVCVCFSS